MTTVPAPSPQAAGNKTVLIVDDEIELAETYALALESNGYRALCAADAAVGWTMAQAYLPDLILCDIDMPGKDGRFLMQEMRADPALADRQFVLMTGKPAYGNTRAAMDLGADDFLLKPVTHQALMNCVAARLRRAELSRRVDDQTVNELRESLGPTLPQKFFVPLANILGITQVLEAELDLGRKDEIRKDLHSIQIAGRRLHRTLRNYLLIADLEPQKKTGPGALLDAKMVQLAMSKGALAAAESYQRGADVVLDLNCASVRAYPADLSSVVEELVDNALSFSRKGTSVKVRAWSEGAKFHFSVTDAGRGLTRPQLESMLLPNHSDGPRVDQPSLGLGLTLVRKLVARLGGEFDIESEAGRCTTSHVSLPMLSEGRLS